MCNRPSLVPRPPQAFIACTASDKSLGRPGYEATIDLYPLLRNYDVWGGRGRGEGGRAR